jgi:hypothetical protein
MERKDARIVLMIREIADMTEFVGNRGDPMVACYITSAFPALLVFAYKYGDDPQRLLLASVNAGGLCSF